MIRSAKWAAIALALAFLALALISGCGVNFKPTTRADAQSLYCIQERLGIALKSNDLEEIHQVITGAMRHVDPMVERHGGKPWFAPRLGSKKEVRLVNIQYGYAESSDNVADVAVDLAMSFGYKVGCWAWDVLPLVPLLLLLWWLYRKWKRMSKAYDAAIETAHPDKTERDKNPAFKDPLVVEAHRELKPKKK